MIVFYDYQVSYRAQPVHTSVRVLDNTIVAKILIAMAKYTQEDAEKAVEKGEWEHDSWKSGEGRYCIELEKSNG